MEPKPVKRRVRIGGQSDSPVYARSHSVSGTQGYPSSYSNVNYNSRLEDWRLTNMLLKFMGGEAWVESEGHGKGLTFWFRLPVKHVEKEQA